MKRLTNACKMAQFSAGNEVLFRHDALIPATVESVKFEGRKVRYVVKVTLVCEVPERLIVNGERGEGRD